MSRTITIEKEIFKYEELSERAKEKVRYNNGECDLEFETDNLKYDFTEQLKEKYPYFENPEFIWSLSNSQGDGLSFSSDFNIGLYLKEFYPKMSNWKYDFICNNLTIYVKYNNGYYCYACSSCVDYDYHTNRCYKIYDDILSHIEDLYIDVCKEFEKQGYMAYEYLYTDDYAKELSEINEYEYDIDGNIF